MRINELMGQRVAVWGFGREGRAVLTALRARLPNLMLTLLCSTSEAHAANAFDPTLVVLTGDPDASVLGGFDVVIKSPGISAYTPALLAAQVCGTQFTSGTALWFAEHAVEKQPDAHVVAITGTKGKSTTTALLAHLARSIGVRTALAGNIGMPLLELLDQTAALWAIELSSFQTGEAGPLELGVITSLYEEHLDWHGSRERYLVDKLKLADVSRRLLVNAEQETLVERTSSHPNRITFGGGSGWHVRAGKICHDGRAVIAADVLTAPGRHNALNACAALAALEAIGHDAVAAAAALATFRPLPHRLQPLGRHDGFDWINDSISTTPLATLAALDSLAGRDITVIVGGHDRGLDWSPFVNAVSRRPALTVLAQGVNGPRIAAALEHAQADCGLMLVDDLAAAVARARAVTANGGVILLSPGAPSFDQFHDYAERGRCFAELAGFDGASISGIAGLGVA